MGGERIAHVIIKTASCKRHRTAQSHSSRQSLFRCSTVPLFHCSAFCYSAILLTRKHGQVGSASMSINILPKDIADELKACAEKASWHCARLRMGKKGAADAEKIDMGKHFKIFKQKSEGLLSERSCDEIKGMFWYAAWHTANTRVGYKSDAKRDKIQMEEHFEKLVSAGDVQKSLATDIKWLGWNCAWYAANKMKGYEDDTVRDKANVESHFQKIAGDVNLVDVKFFMDKAKILEGKPKVIYHQQLKNDVDVTQKMVLKFSVTESKTTSVSNKVGFDYGIKMSFSAGFIGVAEEKYEVSFNFSHEHSWTKSMSTSTTKEYEFPLEVPPHTTYKAEAMVHEADMDVPFEMIFDFGGTKISTKGNWKGVAVSTANYKVEKV